MAILTRRSCRTRENRIRSSNCVISSRSVGSPVFSTRTLRIVSSGSGSGTAETLGSVLPRSAQAAAMSMPITPKT